MSIYTEHFETIFGTTQNIQSLRKKVLECAIRGKLVEQDPNDEPASELLLRIQAEKECLTKEKGNNRGALLPVIDDETSFNIPDKWEWARLGEITNMRRGASPRPIKNYITEDEGGINWIKIGDSTKGQKYIESTVQKITEEGAEKSVLVEPGDLIMSNSMSFGHAYIMNTTGCIHDGWLAFQFGDGNISSEWLLYTLNASYDSFEKLAVGTGVRNLNIDRVKSVVIPVPPLAEQKRIVIKIESLMSEIDNLERYLERKERIEEALPKAVVFAISNCQNEAELKVQLGLVIEYFTEVFQTPESLQELRNVILQLGIQGKLVPQKPADAPASELLKNMQAEKELLIKEKKIKKENALPEIGDDEIPFEIPDSWEWVRLNEICEYIQRGKSPKYSPVEKYPVIAQKCVQWTGVSLEKALFIEPSSIEKYTEERFLLHGDILWNSTGRGSCGRVGVFTDSIRNGFEKIVADSHVTVVRCFKQYVNFDYLFMWLKSPEVQSVIESKASGSTNQIELATSTIKEHLISLPPLGEQQRIMNKIESLLAVIDKLEKEMNHKQRIVKAMATV